MDATDVELRVLGCLIEKQRTTPDAYPLSLNSLRLACNQATNRDPVVSYDEETIRVALAGLSRRGWARLASGRGSRVVKYRHLLDEALGLSHAQCSLLGVLMLRGAADARRAQAAHRAPASVRLAQEVDDVLEGLIERELVARLPRRPGQKEMRYRQLLGGNGEEARRGEGETACRTTDSRSSRSASRASRSSSRYSVARSSAAPERSQSTATRSPTSAPYGSTAEAEADAAKPPSARRRKRRSRPSGSW